MITIWYPIKTYKILDLLADGYFFSSRGEARRAIQQKAKIKIRYFFNKNPADLYITDPEDTVGLYGVDTYLVGSSNYKYKMLDKKIKRVLTVLTKKQ
jgi:hypothetical protein